MADRSCVAVERAQGERMKDRAALVAMLAKPQKMWRDLIAAQFSGNVRNVHIHARRRRHDQFKLPRRRIAANAAIRRELQYGR
jgi:hypothetical protein